MTAERPDTTRGRDSVVATERPSGTASRQPLPGETPRTEAIRADRTDGVPTLCVPITEQAGPREIGIGQGDDRPHGIDARTSSVPEPLTFRPPAGTRPSERELVSHRSENGDHMPCLLRRTRAVAEHIQRQSTQESAHLACVRFFHALRAYESAWEGTPDRLKGALDELRRATTDLTGDPDAFRRACRDPRHQGLPQSLDEPLAEQLRSLLTVPA